jgi:hypothetical protein
MFDLVVICENIFPVAAREHGLAQNIHTAGMVDQCLDLLVCMADILCFYLPEHVSGIGIDIEIGKEGFKADKPEFLGNCMLSRNSCLSVVKNEVGFVTSMEKRLEGVEREPLDSFRDRDSTPRNRASVSRFASMYGFCVLCIRHSPGSVFTTVSLCSYNQAWMYEIISPSRFRCSTGE